jgi:hypothetical protein
MWNLKQSCSPRWELSNGMWHATCTQGNRGNSWLLMVKSQIDNLTSGLSLGHNLCFKYSNGSCELILDIYVPRAFQWYKGLFNPMSFDPWNHPLKIWKSIGTPTPKAGAHLGVWGSFFHTLLHFWKHEIWLLGSLLACTFASLCFGHEPKGRVAIMYICYNWLFWWQGNTNFCDIINIIFPLGIHCFNDMG